MCKIKTGMKFIIHSYDETIIYSSHTHEKTMKL